PPSPTSRAVSSTPPTGRASPPFWAAAAEAGRCGRTDPTGQSTAARSPAAPGFGGDVLHHCGEDEPMERGDRGPVEASAQARGNEGRRLPIDAAVTAVGEFELEPCVPGDLHLSAQEQPRVPLQFDDSPPIDRIVDAQGVRGPAAAVE